MYPTCKYVTTPQYIRTGKCLQRLSVKSAVNKQMNLCLCEKMFQIAVLLLLKCSTLPFLLFGLYPWNMCVFVSVNRRGEIPFNQHVQNN